MHLADTYLSPVVGVAFCVGAGILVGRSTTRLAMSREFERRVPFLAAFAALAFAIRMVQFPLLGTEACGHLGGALLVAALLGPDAAFVVFLAVQIVQAVVFGDGGLLAIGANVVNGAAWPAWVGLPLLRVLAPPGARTGRLIGAAIVASFVAGELAALGVAVALGGGRVDLTPAQLFLRLAWAHLPLAVLEGVATGAALSLGRRVLGDQPGGSVERSGGTGVLVLVGVALFAAAVLADFASSRPEWPQWAVAAGERPGAGPSSPLIAGLVALQQRIAVLPDYGDQATPAGTWFGQAARSVSGLFGAIVSSAVALAPALLVARTRHVLTAARAGGEGGSR